jgi:hypothetical protein
LSKGLVRDGGRENRTSANEQFITLKETRLERKESVATRCTQRRVKAVPSYTMGCFIPRATSFRMKHPVINSGTTLTPKGLNVRTADKPVLVSVT